MTSFVLLSSFILLFSSAAAYTCLTSHHIPPITRDCYALINALDILSHIPPYDTPLRWSRLANDTDSSRYLPKSYRLSTWFPNTCAIRLDAVPSDLDAEDVFSLSHIVNMAEIIVEQCLVRKKKIGSGFPGMRANIQLNLMRADRIWLEGDSQRNQSRMIIKPL